MTTDSSDTESNMGGPRDEATFKEGSLPERSYQWLSSNGLYVEAGIAITALAAGVVALPFVTFGAFTAIGGETSILSAGLIIVAAFVGLLLLLTVVLLIHGYVEMRHRGLLFANGTETPSLVYRGTRLVETLIAGTFLLSLLTVLVTVILTETVPSLILFVTVSTGLLLPALLILHAFGVVSVSVFNLM